MDLENLLKTNTPLYPDDDEVDDVSSEELGLSIPDLVVAEAMFGEATVVQLHSIAGDQGDIFSGFQPHTTHAYGREENKNWWETIEDDDRPFIVFGDMEQMNPKQKKDIKKKIKAVKTAPKKWKEYVFDDKYFKATCENLPKIKDLFKDRGQGAMQKQNMESYYRQTTFSIDQGYAMGTVLKYVISAGGALQTAANKNAMASGILAAKDSLEIMSTVKILVVTKASQWRKIATRGRRSKGRGALYLRIASFVGDSERQFRVLLTGTLLRLQKDKNKNGSSPSLTSCEKILLALKKSSSATQDEMQEQETSESSISSSFKSIEEDCFRITSAYIPKNESQLTYDKVMLSSRTCEVCPVDQCKRMRMDSFLADLPAYMRRSGRNLGADYETCSPEQLRVIKKRLEERHRKSSKEVKEDILEEWKHFADGVGVQTSAHSVRPLCACPKETAQYLTSRDVTDFLPIKREVDRIPKERLFDNEIEFRRFKLLGDATDARRDYSAGLIQELGPIFRSHPSMTSLFNTN
ncbi:hypothetical protein EVAR_79864_1 [Eumeta japonica]|uniref:Uncharacterized protein n=1 Tax=Eumeta variegata TaxID=151549 RepID=A0A4C1TZM9_EUMVA|nr:hypothetical protein EVAR_79864_1 [Eumeta japonica]